MFVPLSSLSLDFLEWLKSLCIDVYIIATFGVVIGVYWERDSAPEAVQHEGWTLLVRALAIELLVGALVFAIDGEISHRQQTTIASQQRTIEQLLRPRRL
ncbi:MAG: hypothetical protein JSR61_22515, partial [Proteobacteria bacterium]|nr:hypothetical protein [Pseudomonadota bacterium]